MLVKFIFTVQLEGVGENQEEAWLDAVESFNQDPGPGPSQPLTHPLIEEEGTI